MAKYYLFFALPKQEAIFRLFSLFIGIGSSIPIPFLNTDGRNFINEILSTLRKSKNKK